MPPLHEKLPARTCKSSYSNYKKYKVPLRKDFSNRCGYCNDKDYYCGGKRGYHIDHFRPKIHFPDLEHIYSNLVYSCPYCNESKRDDWPAGKSGISVKNGKGYIDPCDPDFVNHLFREKNGRIKALTEVGNYMHKHLKLGLQRHQIIWLKEQLEPLLRKVNDVLQVSNENNSNVIQNLKKNHIDLIEEYFKLKDALNEIQ